MGKVETDSWVHNRVFISDWTTTGPTQMLFNWSYQYLCWHYISSVCFEHKNQLVWRTSLKGSQLVLLKTHWSRTNGLVVNKIRDTILCLKHSMALFLFFTAKKKKKKKIDERFSCLYWIFNFYFSRVFIWEFLVSNWEKRDTFWSYFGHRFYRKGTLPLLVKSKISRLASLCSWAGWFVSYLVTISGRQVFLWCGSYRFWMSPQA